MEEPAAEPLGSLDSAVRASTPGRSRAIIAGRMATLAVKVVPGSSRDRVAGRYGDAVKVQVSAPPEGGKANRVVLRLLADFLGIKPDRLAIARGHAQPRKVVEVRGLDQAAVDAAVAKLA